MLVGHGDRAALREALQALVRDPARRRQLGSAARARCEERYDARHQFGLLVGHMEEAIERHRAGARRDAAPAGVAP